MAEEQKPATSGPAGAPPLGPIVGVIAVVVVGALIYFGAGKGTTTPPPGPPQPPPVNGTQPPPPTPPPAGGPTPVETFFPAEKAKEVSPIFEPHAAWPKPEALVALPVKEARAPEVKQKGFELETDVKRWFNPALLPADPDSALGVDDKGQVFLKLGKPGGPVHGIATRNRAPELQTLSFAVTFADAGALDQAGVIKRLESVFVKPLYDEISKRNFRKANETSGPDDFACIVRLDMASIGTVFPLFYVYAKPKSMVGVLQTIPMKKLKNN